MFDNIDLSERDRDGDAVILDLFHQWQAAMKDVDNVPNGSSGGVEEKTFEEKMEVVLEIERRLAGTAASGAAGLAIKGVLGAYERQEPDGGTFGFLLGLVNDAARFAPELGPIAGKLLAASTAPLDIAALRQRVSAIIAEFDMPLPEGSAAIVEVSRRLTEVNARFKTLYVEFDIDSEIEAQEILPHREPLENRLEDCLVETQPQNLVDAATILRFALDYDRLDDGASAETIASNLLALIERDGGAA